MSVSMCDNISDERSITNSGEIHHCKGLSDDIGVLALSEDYSDVRFVVDGRAFPAHKVILAARCHYFRYVELQYTKAPVICQLLVPYCVDLTTRCFHSCRFDTM